MTLDWVQAVGAAAGVALPLFNIPLILKLRRRKSAADFSLSWVLGVWVCIVLMTPAGLRSEDIAFKAYSVVNIIFFTGVLFYVLKYRKHSGGHR